MNENFRENQIREDEFLYQFGRTITQWQSVEAACYEIYRTFMHGANQKLISVNWHNLQSFDARITLLERCAYFILDETTLDGEWKNLKKRLRKASEIRNAIVHSTFGTEVRDGIGTPRLAPSFLDATAIVKKRAMNPDFRFEQDRLRTEGMKFRRLSVDVLKFIDAHLSHD